GSNVLLAELMCGCLEQCSFGLGLHDCCSHRMHLAHAAKASVRACGAGTATATPICGNLIWLSTNLFSGTLSRQSLLQSPLLARLQVVRMTLHFLNDVFRLNLALEPTQG